MKYLLLSVSLSVSVLILEAGSYYAVREVLGHKISMPTGDGRTALSSWKDLPYQVRVGEGRIARQLEDGTVIVNVPYKMDEGTRRISVEPAKTPDQFMVFIGCSFTFGAGVHDDETLPSQFQKLTNDYRVYNYGVGGSSTEEIDYRLRNISRDELKEKNGRVVYSYFYGHLNRHFYLPDFVARWGFSKRVYQEVEGKVVSIGAYEQVHPIRTFWYRLRWKSYFYQLLTEVFPDTVSKDQLREFAGYIGRMSETAKKLSGKRMIVIIWPDSRKPEELPDLLRAQDIDLIDLSHLDIRKLTKNHDKIPYDEHPTAETYAVVAGELQKKIKGP